jgi:hypothetical protein
MDNWKDIVAISVALNISVVPSILLQFRENAQSSDSYHKQIVEDIISTVVDKTRINDVTLHLAALSLLQNLPFDGNLRLVTGVGSSSSELVF